MEPERFVERMLEIENLTDELEDAEAQLLLDWGLAALGPLLADIQDEETAGEKANALMAVMRKINRLVGGMAGKDGEKLAEELSSLDAAFAVVYPDTALHSVEDVTHSAASLAELDSRGALEFILQRLSIHKSTASPVPPGSPPNADTLSTQSTPPTSDTE